MPPSINAAEAYLHDLYDPKCDERKLKQSSYRDLQRTTVLDFGLLRIQSHSRGALKHLFRPVNSS